MQKPKRKSVVKTSKQSEKTRNRFQRVFERVYRLVLRIPSGRVMTYGQIARLLEERYSPRLVGWAMHATPDDGRDIPWHRVINSQGSTSTGRLLLHEPDLQKLMLEAEGVVFDERGRCELGVYQWSPRQKLTTARSSSRRPLDASGRLGSRKRTKGANDRGRKRNRWK